MELNAETLLEWLSSGSLKDMQEMALEQLCGILLMAENIDVTLNLFAPKKFIPVLCAIFVDKSATNNILEITARAITYYLQFNVDTILKLIVKEENTMRAMCDMLVISPDGANKELVEQCIKVLEYVSRYIQEILTNFGGFNNILVFIKNHGSFVHKDILHSAVVTIYNCCQVIDPMDFQNKICLKDFFALLLHEDEHVANKVLDSFHSVACKFSQNYIDPVKIAEFGLLEALSTRLIAATDAASTSTQEVVIETNSKTVSTIFRLLSNLCTRSHSITQQVLRSNFLDGTVLQNVLLLKETTACFLINFVNRLLILICDSREALNEKEAKLLEEHLASPEEVYNNLTECIHRNDMTRLMDIMETKCVIDINYMDSFGQTLTNWAAAIGTHKMVEYLCRKGADVNKGERGSSLHHAASFGNAETARMLLIYGATPDLKDENGKTPMDRAKDGGMFSHNEVVSILNDSRIYIRTPKAEIKTEEEIKSNKEDNSQMAPVYLEFLLPIFCTTVQTTTSDSVRKESLKSIKSMVQYIKSGSLEKLCKSDAGTKKFAAHMAETIRTVLNDEENEENQITTLEITESLMKKGKDIFLNALSRFGIFHQVQNLAGPEGCQVVEETVNPKLEDATEILPRTAYHWHHWCICLNPTGFYAWCDSATLEFSNNSNGWFRSYINGKMYIMYSCGRLESGETSVNRLEFLINIHKAINRVKNYHSSIPILSKPSSTSLVIDNWSITSPDGLELHIKNSENPQQKTTLPLKENGFWHESDNGSKHSFTCQRHVIPKVASGWGKESPKREDNKTIIGRLAYSVHEKYFKNTRIQTRPTMVKLDNIVMRINCNHEDEVLKSALYELTEVLIDKDEVSIYEWQNSGLVPALLLLLGQKKHIQLFRKCFEEKSTNGNNMFALLVQKLIGVLENTEKLPIRLYKTFTNNSIGLSGFRNPFTLVLERGAGEVNLIDRTKESFAAEPSSTVKELEEFLLLMVTKFNSSEASGASNDTGSNASQSEAASGSDAVAEPAVASGTDAVAESAVASGTDAVAESAVASGSETVAEPGSDVVQESEVENANTSASETEVVMVSVIVSISDAVLESPVTSETGTGLATSTLSRPNEIIHLDTSTVESRSAVASGSGSVLVETAVTSRSEETPGLDLGAVAPVQDLAVASEEVVDLNTPASASSAISESVVASGSDVGNSSTPTSKRSKRKPRKTILERILTTDGASSATLESHAELKKTNSSSEGDDSDSSSDEEVKSKDATVETQDVPSESEIKWDKKFVLKSEFPALLPPFDPHPGRVNVNPTTDFEVLPPGIEEFTISPKRESQYQRKLQLTLQIHSMDTKKDSPVKLELCNGNQTMFSVVQELTQLCKLKEPMRTKQYKIVYRELKNDDASPKPSSSEPKSKIEEVLQLLRHLFAITTSKMTSSSLALTSDRFISKKISNKLMLQIKDALVVSCSGTPTWCEELIKSNSFLFPFETRQIYFQSTAFGTTRTLMWFQAQYESVQEVTHPRSDRRSNTQIGRLTTERIRVQRGDTFLGWAMQVMKMHFDRKAKLEIQFIDEEGTGLGPTLEFYALAAAELQRRDLAMWICDDEPDENVSDGAKAPGYYVRTKSGLFPTPLPQDSYVCDEAVKYFWFLGIILAKVLLDNRLIDLPLSNSFLKLMCHRSASTAPWYQGALDFQDLYDIDPIRGKFLKEVQRLVKEKTAILKNAALCSYSKKFLIEHLKVNHTSGPMSLKDLALNFTYAPSSNIFGISAMELVPNGADVEVTIENLDEYSDLTLSFALEKGIARQLEAFHQGFSEVFLMENLAVFSPNELRMMLCGDQNPQWTKEDLINYTEPKLGYTKESPEFLRFVNVLMDISPEEKKAFLQFATGCSSLPPGGLANLHPPLTVVKKIDAGDGSYPSVNTCVHYIKLPEYSTEEILKERLLTAIKETGFHFN